MTLYLFFPLWLFLITGTFVVFFLNNVSYTSQLLLCKSLVPKAWLLSWDWKSLDQNKWICYVKSRGFYFLLCSTHFKTEYPLLCNFFLELCPKKTIVLNMCLVFDSTVLPDRNRLFYFWFNCSYRAAPYYWESVWNAYLSSPWEKK